MHTPKGCAVHWDQQAQQARKQQEREQLARKVAQEQKMAQEQKVAKYSNLSFLGLQVETKYSLEAETNQ